MGFMRRLLLAVVLLLLGATPARADDAGEVALALRSSPVYQAQGLDLVEVASLSSELSGLSPRVVVAVLPASAAASAEQARARAVDIGRELGDPDAVVLVITANKHLGTSQGHAAATRGVDSGSALAAELPDLSSLDFSKDNVTAFVTSFAERIATQASTDRTTATSTSSSHSGAWLLGGLVLLGVAGAAVVVVSLRRRRARPDEDPPADLQPFLLGGILPGVDSGDGTDS